ncbi:hypothetical protein GCM10010397_61730 [Streptomyces spinoverrucosus]|nr:hypothetical protein GCM10010397_61730 [Streptomyces spinoverrucosus]
MTSVTPPVPPGHGLERGVSGDVQDIGVDRRPQQTGRGGRRIDDHGRWREMRARDFAAHSGHAVSRSSGP